MYLAPNYAFNDDPKESMGFLLAEPGVDEHSWISYYQVKGEMSSSDREVELRGLDRLPLGNPFPKGEFWMLDDSGNLTISTL